MSKLSKKIGFVVQSKTEKFHQDESSWSRAALAKLRRGVGKELGEIPEILEYVLLDLPGEVVESERDTERAEIAIYTALTMFAVHQQGKEQFMGKEEQEDKQRQSFGQAVRILTNANSDHEKAIKRRFDKVLSSYDLKELSVHARSIIGLLKAANIPLDYAAFAEDLFWFQNSDFKRSVILKWTQDYFRYNKKDIQEKGEK